jgi:protein dithiol oxidoreductase (disulfide-forming)
LATMPAPVNVPGFKEGVHYHRLVPVQPTGAAIGTVHIAEVFWYGCKPCFDIDAKIDAWRAKHKPVYVSFERLPATADALQRFHARAFYVLDQLGKLDVLHSSLFAEIQDGAAIADAGALAKFLSAHEIDQRAIAAALKSDQLEPKIDRATDLERRYRVDSLPYFVVGGKFVTTVAMAGDDDRLLTLLTQLSIREHEF